jgi:hypothetical protein
MFSVSFSYNLKMLILLNITKQTKFQNLQSLIEVFNYSLLQQSKDLMQLMDSEATEIVSIASKLSAAAHSLKDGLQSSFCGFNTDDMFHQSDSILLQYSKIKEKSEILLSFCSSFEVCVPDEFETIKMLDDCLKPFLHSWELFKEFKTQLDVMSQLSWIHFRFNLSKLEEFCGFWEERIKDFNCDSQAISVVGRVHSEINSLKKSLPALQHCTGLDFRDAHWCDVLQGKLSLPKTVRLETLCFYHFLQRLDIVNEDEFLEFVKLLNTR